LHVHHSTVRRWEKIEALPCHRVGPKGAVRFNNKDIMEFVNKAGYPLNI
jgi:hypothetical protein